MKQHEEAPLAVEVQPLLAQDEDVYNVEFDVEKGVQYRTCIGSCAAVMSCIGCVLLPWMRPWQQREMESQKCQITDKRVIFEQGWLNKSTKYIPLERIQDINVNQDCGQRCFGIHSIEIQTAGGGLMQSNGSRCAEATLLAPANAEMVRDALLERRDALVYHHLTDKAGKNGAQAPRYGAMHARIPAEHGLAVTDQISSDIQALRASVERIEAVISHHGRQTDKNSDIRL